MKRFLGILFIAALLLSGCSNSTKPNSYNEKVEGVRVEKSASDVTITQPASFYKDDDINVVAEEMKNEGMKDVRVNADGSLTFKMSKSKYNEMMAEKKADLLGFLEELKTSGKYPLIKDIKHHSGFRTFSLEMTEKDFDPDIGKALAIEIGEKAALYRNYTGIRKISIQVTIDFRDMEKRNIFYTIVYPDDIKKKVH